MRINDFMITSFSIKHNINSITVLQIENLSHAAISDLELELLNMNSPKQSLKLLKPKETKNIHFPWLPEIGIQDYCI